MPAAGEAAAAPGDSSDRAVPGAGRGRGCAQPHLQPPAASARAAGGSWCSQLRGGGFPSCLAFPTDPAGCSSRGHRLRDRPCLRALGHGGFLEVVTPGASLPWKEGGAVPRDVPRAASCLCPHPPAAAARAFP